MYPSHTQHLNQVTEDTIFFFSHAFDPLNNWSAHQVLLWGTLFPTVEHGFHYRKFSDQEPEIAACILSATSPYVAFQLAKQHKPKRRVDWDAIKENIMTELVHAKVTQHDDVRKVLVATGGKTIVENSPWDDFWGNGPAGIGRNKMGIILMRARDALKREET